MSAKKEKLLPRASLMNVLRGKAPLVGSRTNPDAARGFVSPIEARLAMGIPYGSVSDLEAEALEALNPSDDMKVLARTLFARAVSSAGGDEAERPHIVSAPVDNITIPEALDAIMRKTSESTQARMVHFVHPHALNLATFDETLARRFREADLVLPDGVGVRIAAQMLGVMLQHNINGTDLLPLICTRAANEGVPLVLIGAKPSVAQECAQKLRERFSGLHIPIVQDGYGSEAEMADAVSQLRKLCQSNERAIALVGMGTPLQEAWSWSHLRHIPGLTVLTVGGLFDFYSERVVRAPIAWREVGLEWLWRTLQEPTRLGPRYFLGNPLFLSLAALQRLKKR